MVKKWSPDDVIALSEELNRSNFRLIWKGLIKDLKTLKEEAHKYDVSVIERELKSVESAIINSDREDQPQPDSHLMH